MFKALTPIFALIIAAGLAVTYVSPAFSEIKQLQDKAAEYARAIDNAEQLKSLIAEKIAARNAFDPNDLEDLAVMLPESVDEVSLIMDIDALAQGSHLALSDIAVSSPKPTEIVEEPMDIEPADMDDPTADLPQPAVTHTPTDFSFIVTGSYEDMRTFVARLEESLVFMDIMNLKFAESEGDLTAYAMTVRAYAFTIKD